MTGRLAARDTRPADAVTVGSRSAEGSRSAVGSRSASWAALVGSIARDRVDRAVFAVSVVAVGLAYSLLLPYAFTQHISFANWSYIDARYVAFTVAFALGLGWLITLQVHAVRGLAHAASEARGAAATGPAGVLAAVVSVLPSLLCCSPILPTLIGLIGLSATARLSTTVQLQHFFATEENVVLLGALGLLLLSILWAMRKLARASCLDGGRCAPPSAGNDLTVTARRRMQPAGAPTGSED
jgi:hypothetical protein